MAEFGVKAKGSRRQPVNLDDERLQPAIWMLTMRAACLSSKGKVIRRQILAPIGQYTNWSAQMH